jgi:hypothetical protein
MGKQANSFAENPLWDHLLRYVIDAKERGRDIVQAPTNELRSTCATIEIPVGRSCLSSSKPRRPGGRKSLSLLFTAPSYAIYHPLSGADWHPSMNSAHGQRVTENGRGWGHGFWTLSPAVRCKGGTRVG